MVSPRRYLQHHEAEADRISRALTVYGRSGDTPGFWCRHGAHTGILDCLRCPDENICHHESPPLTREYNPDEDNWRRYRGDHMLLMLHEGRGVDDYLWLQHPETRRR